MPIEILFYRNIIFRNILYIMLTLNFTAPLTYCPDLSFLLIVGLIRAVIIYLDYYCPTSLRLTIPCIRMTTYPFTI